jgi:hypothetical protein
MNERTQFSIKLILTHVILLPVLIFIPVLSISHSFLLLSITQTALLILFLSGYWEFFGLRFRNTYCLLTEMLILIVLLWRLPENHLIENTRWISAILILLLLCLLFQLVKILIVIFKRDKGYFEIGFPFKNGKYLITDGGNSKISRMMNYHFFSQIHKKKKTNFSMQFATDIIKIKDSGPHFLPGQNEDYPVFGEKVFSPIDGIVVKIENTIDDNVPYCGNYPYSTGNTIVIQKDSKYLILGHLKKNSIIVKVGENINTNDLIAEAGNSGYSERPHIHMQLIKSLTDNYWYGSGISIQFNKKNLYKNRVIKI